MSTQLTEIESAIRVRMSPKLLRWFTSYAPKHGHKRKLPFEEKNGEYFYDSKQLDEFDRYLKEEWPKPERATRPGLPQGIKEEIIIEADHKCAFCQYNASGEGAHIDPVSLSGCNHPHNLIWTCPNHHTEYDNGVTTLLTAEHVKVIKEMLLDTQLRKWRIELRLVDGVLSLLCELGKIRGRLLDPNLADIGGAIKAHAKAVLVFAKEQASKRPEERHAPTPQSDAYESLLKKIEAIPAVTDETVDEASKEIDEATKHYLSEAGLALCPVCNGSGTHWHGDCPVCGGEGSMDEAVADQVDVHRYDTVECPLCEGEGMHDGEQCPECRGEGTMPRCAADQVDLRRYDAVECPLCEGEETHDGEQCPECHGEGTMPRWAADQVEVRRYDAADCPLCEGEGTHDGEQCPECHGEGTMPRWAADQVEVRRYDAADCPLCEGEGMHDGEQCPECHGEGTMPRWAADQVDLRQYDAVDCPLCEGEGTHEGEQCPPCRGEGQMPRWAAERVDPRDY